MAIITKQKIIDRIKSGNITLTPTIDIFQLQAHAVDLRLGFLFRVPRVWHITKNGRESLEVTHFDKINAHHFETITLTEGQFFDLLPGEHVIVSTLESIKVPNDLMAVLYPRSSANRKGLSLDLTGIIDSGYEGHLVLPIRNNTNSQVVRLYPGERICQIVFEELVEEVNARKSKYHKEEITAGAKKEKRIEAELILKGNIKKLKKEYAVK